MKLLIPIVFILFSCPLFGQDEKEGGESAYRVELRKVEEARAEREGSVPDSLDRKYFIHDNGKVYKHFPIYEQALAHYRGYYPREELDTEKGAIYISASPTLEGAPPKAFRVYPEEGKVETLR